MTEAKVPEDVMVSLNEFSEVNPAVFLRCVSVYIWDCCNDFRE